MAANADRIDVAALAQHARAVRLATRSIREPAAVGAQIEVDAIRARWRRERASGLASRRGTASLAEIASGGLQDSAPRAAQVALHARAVGVDVRAWEHPDLAQLWLRWAAYVVPRADAAIFSRGALPRDARRAAALRQLADAVVAIIGDAGAVDSKVVSRALRGAINESLLRACCLTGRVLIRWDVRTTSLLAIDRPTIDDDEARAELARRFLRWMAPAAPHHFAKWAGLAMSDAADTWRSIGQELVSVAMDGKQRWVLAEDAEALAAASAPSGVRLLAPGDPALFMDRADEPPTRAADVSNGITPRLANSLTGRLLVDGSICGAWGRVGGNVTVDPWSSLPSNRHGEIDEEARALDGPIGHSITVRWLPPASAELRDNSFALDR